jgi:hypothetical protein
VEALESGLALAERGLGDDARVAAQHVGPVDLRPRQAGGLSHRVGHHAGERALPDAAGDQRAQEALLRLGGASEEVVYRVAARGLRPGTGQRRNRLERRVDVVHLQARLVRGRRRVAQRRPAHAGAALAQLAAQVGDAGLDLVGGQPAQRVAEQLGLALARTGAGHGARDGCEVGEEHAAS